MKFKGIKFGSSFKKRTPPGYNSSEDWVGYGNYVPPPNRTFGRRKPPRKRFFTKAVIAAAVLLLLIAVRNSPGPLGDTVKNNLRYVLTTQWNYEPVLQKVVQLGLRLANVETPEVNGSTVPVIAPQKEDGALPVPVSGKVCKNFGWVKDELDGMERYHAGIDIKAAQGVPVQAVLNGKVQKIGKDSKLGQFVLLDHGNGRLTMYAGLQNVSVKEGEQVQAGRIIAEIGTGGDIKGTGLHFEMRENKKLVDPLKRLRQNGQDW